MSHAKKTGDKLSAAGWGLFLIWVGVLFIGGLSTAIGLSGIGVITLGVQTARLSAGLEYERFWVLVGALFLAGAAWEFFTPSLPLISVVLILGGVVVLRSAIGRR